MSHLSYPPQMACSPRMAQSMVNQAFAGSESNNRDTASDRSLSPTAPPTDGSSDDFLTLLARARDGDTEGRGTLLQWYANYLSILASTQLDRRLRRRVNPSDVVQETMLAAHRDFADFRGESQPELLGWLRRILINTLHRNFETHVSARKRDIRREVSIDQASARMDESASNLASRLEGRVDSPSAPMRAREQSVEFADQLTQLKPHYREIIVLRILQGLSFDEIAQRMDRSPGAVRMLWLRALEQFKSSEQFKSGEPFQSPSTNVSPTRKMSHDTTQRLT